MKVLMFILFPVLCFSQSNDLKDFFKMLETPQKIHFNVDSVSTDTIVKPIKVNYTYCVQILSTLNKQKGCFKCCEENIVETRNLVNGVLYYQYIVKCTSLEDAKRTLRFLKKYYADSFIKKL